MTIWIALTAGSSAAAEVETVTFDFNGGEGNPSLIKREGPLLDGKAPFHGGPNLVLRGAPQDRVTLEVIDRPKDLIGKVLAHKAVFVRKTRSGGFLGLFPKEKRHLYPDSQWSQLPITLDLGKGSNAVRVILEVHYRTGDPERRCFALGGKKIDLVLRRPGKVFVFLKPPSGRVAWQDRDPSGEEQQKLTGHMNERKQQGAFPEAHLTGKRVFKGNVGQIKVRLVASRVR
jgi:hypothetical protein